MRFYTYISTLGYVMEEAAKARVPVFVLDRPNPIGGLDVRSLADADKLPSRLSHYSRAARDDRRRVGPALQSGKKARL